MRFWKEDKGDSPLCGLAAGRHRWPRISGLATVVTAGPCADGKFLWHWNSVVTESAILPHSLLLVGSASYGWFSSPHKTHRSWLTLIGSAQKQATELQSWLRGQSTDEVKSLDLQTPHQTWVGVAVGVAVGVTAWSDPSAWRQETENLWVKQANQTRQNGESKFRDGPCVNLWRGQQSRKVPDINFWPQISHKHVCTYIQTYTYTHVREYTHRHAGHTNIPPQRKHVIELYPSGLWAAKGFRNTER